MSQNEEKKCGTSAHHDHIKNLTKIGVALSGEKNNGKKQGPFSSVIFSEDQMRELRMAAWLHDVGKITTPEHVVDKSTKLEKVYDRISDVKTRFELLKREYQLAMQENKNTKAGNSLEKMAGEIKTLDEEYQFLVQVNRGGELDRKSTRLNSSHANISYAVFCL